MKHLNRWRNGGTIAIIVLGFLFHDLYLWTGSVRLTGLLLPVNESVWEHLKLGYWAVALLSVFEYPRVRGQVNNYILARVAGIVALELSILVIYYGYRSFSGRNILLLDISSYIAGAIVCQQLTYSLFRCRPFSRYLNGAALVAFLALGLLFAVFTYDPPRVALFEDNNDHTFGIKP